MKIESPIFNFKNILFSRADLEGGGALSEK